MNNMAKLEIKKFPDPILRKKCEDVKEIDSEIKNLIDSMMETQDSKDGLGLAASQVGISKKIIVIGKNAYINPKILKKGREKIIFEEGCLSFPGLFLKLKRPKEIEIEFLSPNGEKLRMKAEGLKAVIFQHEIDHINGILFIDHLTFWQKLKLKNKYVIEK